MRLNSITLVAGKLLNFQAADDVQKHMLGTRFDAVDGDYNTNVNVGNGGYCELAYVRGTAAFTVGRLVHVDKDFNILDVPVTGNTGRPVFVVVSPFTAAANFGYVGRVGTYPVQYSVAATAGAVFAGAAGQATPTAAGGRQILNAVCLLGSAAAFTRPIKTSAGLPNITVNDTAGVYPGQAISGTGIPGGTTVLAVDADARILRLSANATAAGSVTATFTNTGFGFVNIGHPFVQGQIT